MNPRRFPIFIFILILLSTPGYPSSSSTDPFTVMGGTAQRLWNHFAVLCTLPRLSLKEEPLRQYIRRLAETRQLSWKQDQAGNLIVFVPATPGREKQSELILHAHLDMVGDKVAGSPHDFSRDPILCRRDGDWLTASGTTLGADNGIGVAAILSLLDEPDLRHGPLRLLFTVDEEGGFTGADGIDPAFLQAPRLINLDSEESREFNIGCAGGVTHCTDIPITNVQVHRDDIALHINISGLTGGHSGVEIHHGRANAVRLLARLLLTAQRESTLQIAGLKAGTFDTTIPRDAECLIWISRSQHPAVQSRLMEAALRLCADFAATDPKMRISIDLADPSSLDRTAWSNAAAQALPTFLLSLPAGVLIMSASYPGQVETSANPGVLRMESDHLTLMCHLQSSSKYALRYLSRRMAYHARIVHGVCREETPYEPWQPKSDSVLVKRAIAIHQRLFGSPPLLKVVHAGLECGSFARANPQLDMLSFGPSILGAHTPDERVSISSVEDFRQLLIALVEADF